MIGILNAYHVDPTPGNYQEQYADLISNFVREAFPDQPLRFYKIAQGDWPSNPQECDVWIITGSGKGAYDKDEWIMRLKQFVVRIDREKEKLIGICFGHQVIAAALGGEVIKSPKGWGVGVKDFSVLALQPWMQPPLKQVKLLFSHQDQVTKIPPQAKLLAQDSFCEFQMYQIGDHILTMQGHPEFTREFLSGRLESRRTLIEPKTLNAALSSLTEADDRSVLASWIRNFAAL